MSLLPLIAADTSDDDARAFLAEVPPLNLFRALASAPVVAQQAAQFGGALLFRTEFDPQLREIAILRSAHLVGNAYEIGHHERIARDLGMSEARIAATRQAADEEDLPEAEFIAARWAEEVVSDRRASRPLVERTLKVFGVRQTIELAMTVGYYLMIAQFLESFEIPFEGAGFEEGVKVR